MFNDSTYILFPPTVVEYSPLSLLVSWPKHPKFQFHIDKTKTVPIPIFPASAAPSFFPLFPLFPHLLLSVDELLSLYHVAT
jgi:hypothetical protein